MYGRVGGKFEFNLSDNFKIGRDPFGSDTNQYGRGNSTGGTVPRGISS
jgi:hypothetical protein